MERIFFCWKKLYPLWINSYNLLGLACQYCDSKFWKANLFEMFKNSIFSNLQTLDIRNLKDLFDKFLNSFVRSCPPQLHDSLLLRVLCPLYQLVNNKLNHEWSLVIKRNKGYYYFIFKKSLTIII